VTVIIVMVEDRTSHRTLEKKEYSYPGIIANFAVVSSKYKYHPDQGAVVIAEMDIGRLAPGCFHFIQAPKTFAPWRHGPWAAGGRRYVKFIRHAAEFLHGRRSSGGLDPELELLASRLTGP
jgi:hypothetical protein